MKPSYLLQDWTDPATGEVHEYGSRLDLPDTTPEERFTVQQLASSRIVSLDGPPNLLLPTEE